MKMENKIMCWDNLFRTVFGGIATKNKGCPRREDSLFCYGFWLGNQSSNRMFMISQAAFATLVPGPNTAATPA